MTVEQTVNKINTACTDMKKAFKDLADRAEPSLQQMTSAIGALTQYKVEGVINNGPGIPGTPFTEYRDSKPRWWERLVTPITSVTEVPHPKREEAQKKADAMFGTAKTNDENFKLDTNSIAETPEKVGKLITDWLKISNEFSKKIAQVIPSNVVYIPTTGNMDGWLSPGASGAYAASVSSQDNAAGTTSSVMSDLMDNCAKFLESLTTSLADFAKLTNSQDEFYSNLITKCIPKQISFSQIMDLIDAGVSTINKTRSDETEKSTNMATMLNNTIAQLLAIEKLDRQITEMGESQGDNGWPKPAKMSVSESSETPAASELRFNTQYFHDHSKFWRQVSADLSTLKTSSDSVVEIPTMFARLPQFSADQSTALNSLCDRISADALGKGATATSDLADLLDSTITDYLKAEAENTDTARQVYKEIYGTEMP
ncbi:hypothetical protein HMPREF1531_00412 [Propionibacterium sp. oral taxon 192 str. F0372]|uniref:hypothetical protein n=1 Tax=Propionibacterium sp. oral taxon 192 TaxID=671222 RepID=UPI000352FE71|nr:hypothetical protein [Propionibacterium sp. oral taxon 192]EPH06810.1 hypothetical protein HMPREF1531_00412 [Propionibacterium sp. oral taxon 192 str. F0372]